VELLVNRPQGGRFDHFVEPVVAHGFLLCDPSHRFSQLLAAREIDEANGEDLALVLESSRGDRAATAEAESLVWIPGLEEVLVCLPLSKSADEDRDEHASPPQDRATEDCRRRPGAPP